jgi:ribosomal protein S12 methylthiotransferase
MIMSTNRKLFLVNLGCAKNLVDSENMLGLIRARGFDLAPALAGADIAVINTCAFIQAAVEETIDTILEAVNLKKNGDLQRVLVAGCFVQRYGYKLRKEIPEVDGWLGTGEVPRIVDLLDDDLEETTAPFFIGRPGYLAGNGMPRIQTTPFYTAYLKIAEGCSHACTYCLIPKLRGTFRSRRMAALVQEAAEMADRGAKEINLVAQDITFYGKDLGGNVGLEDLLERLVRIHGIRWIRLLYCHPYGISDRLLRLIQSEDKICPYLDLPLQHVNKEILRDMGRDQGEEDPLNLIERIKSGRREISIRTTLMVGFPGETESQFNELRDFVNKARLDHLGVFVFSPEKGTPAACLKTPVEHEVARQRLDEIMTLQSEISKTKNQQLVGEVVHVMIEGPCPETDLLLSGRTEAMAPDVDGRVLINKGDGVMGEIMPVVIREAHAYDLIGEII